MSYKWLALWLAFTSAAAAAEPTGELQVRIVDAQTKQPLAARVSVKAADNTFPGDRIALAGDKWPNLEAHGVFVSGEATFKLPPGKTLVAVSRGPQHRLDEQTVEVVAGKTVAVDVALKRDIDLRKLGWVGGDAHLHVIHGEMQRATSYADVAITCRANGLDWAYANQEYVGAGELTLEGFHNECRKVSDEGFQLLLGGERPKSLLGHNALIGVENPFVIPDDPPYHAAAHDIHQQGGVLFPVHPLRYFPGKQYLGQWLDFPGNNLGREIVFDAFLGPSFDGLSVLSDEPNDRRAHQLWFNLLNRGLFVPALADSDACFDRPTLGKNVPGWWTTYLYVGADGKADNASLAEAIRQGRTMATTGPLILWTIDGNMSGATVPNDGKPREVSIEVRHAHHNWTLEPARVAKVELLRNGAAVRVWEPNTPDAKLSLTIHESEPCWYAVRAFGTDQKWQVAVASPIYFAPESKPAKRAPLMVRVRGRVYDHVTGKERRARMVAERDGKELKAFEVEGQFAVDMPLDATLTAIGEKDERLSHNLLLDYGPVHRFLWKLDSEALSKPETLDRLEDLVREVELEFPLGHRLAGCYAAKKLTKDTTFESMKVMADAPSSPGSASLASILLDKCQAQAGDTINVAAIFHNPGGDAKVDPLLVVEGRAYNPDRPTGFNPLKVFGTIEAKWSAAKDAGNGYRMITGKLVLPEWAAAPLEINAFARGAGGKYVSQVGLRLPWGPTMRELMVVSNWPTIPVSWPDHNYGIGPLKVCGKIGRDGQPQFDYRSLALKVATSAGDFDLCPERDCLGCADADDAVYTGHYLDQVLNDETKLITPAPVRKQPTIKWRKLPVVDATEPR
jgi:hypothetical protein